MTDLEYKNLLSSIEQKCQIAMEKALIERKIDLAALDRLKTLSERNQSMPTAAQLSLRETVMPRQIQPGSYAAKLSATNATTDDLYVETSRGEDWVRSLDRALFQTGTYPEDIATILKAVYPAIQRGTLKDAVVRAIGSLPGEFRAIDVEHWVRKNYPSLANCASTSISSALIRMAEDGEVYLIRRGSGQLGSVYRRR